MLGVVVVVPPRLHLRPRRRTAQGDWRPSQAVDRVVKAPSGGVRGIGGHRGGASSLRVPPASRAEQAGNGGWRPPCAVDRVRVAWALTGGARLVACGDPRQGQSCSAAGWGGWGGCQPGRGGVWRGVHACSVVRSISRSVREIDRAGLRKGHERGTTPPRGARAKQTRRAGVRGAPRAPRGPSRGTCRDGRGTLSGRTLASMTQNWPWMVFVIHYITLGMQNSM